MKSERLWRHPVSHSGSQPLSDTWENQEVTQIELMVFAVRQRLWSSCEISDLVKYLCGFRRSAALRFASWFTMSPNAEHVTWWYCCSWLYFDFCTHNLSLFLSTSLQKWEFNPFGQREKSICPIIESAHSNWSSDVHTFLYKKEFLGT